MDILRRALEEAATAEAAVDFIAHFVETRAQGGNGAYKGKLFYDNSYMVVDFTDAWIIETAGHRWAGPSTDRAWGNLQLLLTYRRFRAVKTRPRLPSGSPAIPGSTAWAAACTG